MFALLADEQAEPLERVVDRGQVVADRVDQRGRGITRDPQLAPLRFAHHEAAQIAQLERRRIDPQVHLLRALGELGAAVELFGVEHEAGARRRIVRGSR